MKLIEVFAKPKGKIKWGFKSSTKWEGQDDEKGA